MNEGDLLLALETSTRQGSAALLRGGAVAAERDVDEQQRHVAGLLPVVEALLADVGAKPADVRIIAFSHGPGSFTGLRVAATVARMWRAVVDARVVAVPTLAVIAENAREQPDAPARIAPVIDARRGQVFSALYERDPAGGWHTQEVVALRTPADWFAELPRPLGVLGPGAESCRAAAEAAGATLLPESTWRPRAAVVARLAAQMAADERFCDPAEITPLYIRPPECEEVYEQRRSAAIAKRSEQDR